MIKQMAEAEKQKPKRKAHKKKTHKFDRVLLEEWAVAVKERDGYVCTVCGIDDERKVHAHHKLSKSKHPELAYDVATVLLFVSAVIAGYMASISKKV